MLSNIYDREKTVYSRGLSAARAKRTSSAILRAPSFPIRLAFMNFDGARADPELARDFLDMQAFPPQIEAQIRLACWRQCLRGNADWKSTCSIEPSAGLSRFSYQISACAITPVPSGCSTFRMS